MDLASSGITDMSALLSVDEAIVGFSGAAQRRVIFRVMPAGQGVRLTAAVAHYNNFLGGIDYADQWRPMVHPAGALHVLSESRQSAACVVADVRLHLKYKDVNLISLNQP